MLSILIPTYNYNITKLVQELQHQAVALEVDFEIIVMEDGSEKYLDENQSVAALDHCKYIRLKENAGRSAIRNKLADAARFDYLLFLDCDAAIVNRNFLNKYISFCGESCVVLGGRIYDALDKNPEFSLLRKYGTEKEANTLKNMKIRHQYPVFTSPNFLIEKQLFNKVRFDEKIVGYGHEDTIFGLKLQELNISFIYIDNPVVHVGLESNSIFLLKTEESVRKLYQLFLSGNYKKLAEVSRLLQIFCQLKRYRLMKLFSIKFRVVKSLLMLNLTGKNPSLLVYDLYKILFLCYYADSTDKLAVGNA